MLQLSEPDRVGIRSLAARTNQIPFRRSRAGRSKQNGRREQGQSGGGGRFDLDYFTDEIIDGYVRAAVDAALTNLESRPAPAGEMTVVLGPGWPGVLLHEAVGRGLLHEEAEIGDGAEVVRPKALRDGYADWLRETLSRYK